MSSRVPSACIQGWTLALAASALGGCVTPPSQTYRSIYQVSDSAGLDSTSLTNHAELGVQAQAGPGVEYRLDERLIYSDRELSVGGGDISAQDFLSQSSADLVLAAGTLAWSQGVELTDSRASSEQSSTNSLIRKDLSERLDWTPEDLPQVSTRLDYRTEEDNQFLSRDTTELLLEVHQELGPVDYYLSYLDQVIENRTSRVETDRTQQLFRGSYQDDYLEGKLTTSASVFVDERQSKTTRSLSGGDTETSLPSSAGLSLVDSTPQIAILQPTPALTDGNFTTSTGINIGGFAAGGVLDSNLGAELPGGSTIDVIRIVTVDEVDPFLVNQFAFTVWASDDNEFWSLVASPASFQYEVADRSFRISIPPVSNQYIKVVNTVSPATAPAVFVAELRVFNSTAGIGGNSSRVDESVRNVTTRMAYRLTEEVTVSYDVLLQDSKSVSVGATTRDETRIDHGVAMIWTPTQELDVTVRAQQRRIDDRISPDERVRYTSGQANLRPLETVDWNLSFSRTEREEGNLEESDTRSAQTGISAQLLDTLSMEVVYGLSDQDDFFNLRTVRRTVFSAALIAELSRFLELTLGARNENATVTGAGASGITDPTEERYELTVVFQPSSQVTADATLEWVDTFAGAGLDQRIRVDWIPFRDGKLDLQFNVDRVESNSISTERVDRYQVLTRWSLNQRAFFELNYATQVPDISARTDLITASFNVTL